MREENRLIEAVDLKKHFPVKGVRGPGVRAVDGVSFSIGEGQTLGLVGESGCGKTTLARTLLRLYEPTAGRILYRGAPLFDSGGFPLPGGEDGAQRVTRPMAADMRPYRRRLQLTFQDAAAALDPRMTAGETVGEALDIHRLASGRAERAERIEAALGRVGLDAGLAGRYPHELSGGQQQRLGLARALAVEPELIVCDEPVSALDMSVRAQIVNLLEELQRDLGLSYLLIAHDLSVVRRTAGRVAVMYLGGLVELAPGDELFSHPIHPYTQTLLSAAPLPDPAASRARRRVLPVGEPPGFLEIPSGCPFHPRCPYAAEACAREASRWKEHAPGHFAACRLAE